MQIKKGAVIMRAIYLCNNPKRWASVYAPEIRARLAALYDIADVCFTAADLEGQIFPTSR